VFVIFWLSVFLMREFWISLFIHIGVIFFVLKMYRGSWMFL
jgi:hypothetical protein